LLAQKQGDADRRRDRSRRLVGELDADAIEAEAVGDRRA
jgi:hypothetical protein